ncbi:MAG: AraC family transcriptional regulator N-terminal domain-containing protein [Ruegeria sp.]
MSKEQIKQLIADYVTESGAVEFGVKGVQLFRVTEPRLCAPAIYEPCVVAIVGGSKEAILGGERYLYDSSKYLCCPMSMPVEAGTPEASPENPLLGALISLNSRVMTELVVEMENTSTDIRQFKNSPHSKGLTLAKWDTSFTDALLGLLKLGANPTDARVLGAGRLREFFYAVLKGEAGNSARRAFGEGNEIARTIKFLSTRLHEPVTIDEMAEQVGMSRAVFHRRFKQATAMSPIQFVKTMRLNSAAMKIAGGMNISKAAMGVGYVSSSQFSREFKRLYGETPRDWSQVHRIFTGGA